MPKFKGLYKLVVNPRVAQVTLLTEKGTKVTIEVSLKDDEKIRESIDQIIAILVQRYEQEL